MNNYEGNEESRITDNGTEVLLLEEQSYQIHHEKLQATEVLGVLNEKILQECSSTRHQNVDAPSPAKATSMGRVMEFVSRLPNIDEADDLWMDAYDFLAQSKAARELLVSRRVDPNIKVKWLKAKVKKFKN